MRFEKTAAPLDLQSACLASMFAGLCTQQRCSRTNFPDSPSHLSGTLCSHGRLSAADWLEASDLAGVRTVGCGARIAQDARDAKLLARAASKYGWIERLTRCPFLSGFWGPGRRHAFLYAGRQSMVSTMFTRILEMDTG